MVIKGKVFIKCNAEEFDSWDFCKNWISNSNVNCIFLDGDYHIWSFTDVERKSVGLKPITTPTTSLFTVAWTLLMSLSDTMDANESQSTVQLRMIPYWHFCDEVCVFILHHMTHEQIVMMYASLYFITWSMHKLWWGMRLYTSSHDPCTNCDDVCVFILHHMIHAQIELFLHKITLPVINNFNWWLTCLSSNPLNITNKTLYNLEQLDTYIHTQFCDLMCYSYVETYVFNISNF